MSLVEGKLYYIRENVLMNDAYLQNTRTYTHNVLELRFYAVALERKWAMLFNIITLYVVLSVHVSLLMELYCARYAASCNYTSEWDLLKSIRV